MPEECSSLVYRVLDEDNRYWSAMGGRSDDQGLISNQWYRFTGGAGKMMATYCIPSLSCSSFAGSWISGEHPMVAYELVSTTVCMHGIVGGCCSTSYPVDIRNCSGYYVYKLQNTRMFQRYCGVKGKRYDRMFTGSPFF